MNFTFTCDFHIRLDVTNHSCVVAVCVAVGFTAEGWETATRKIVQWRCVSQFGLAVGRGWLADEQSSSRLRLSFLFKTCGL